METQSLRSVAMVHVSLLTAQIIFSGNQIASKIGVRYFQPSIFILFRCLLVVPFMCLAAKLKEKEFLPKTRREVIYLLAMGAFSFVAFECFIFGMQITSVATGTTLQATSPLWTLLVALVLKLEAPSFMKVGGVICAIIGAAITVAGNNILQELFGYGPDSVPTGNSDFPGGLLLIGNAMLYSGFVTMQKYVLRTIKPLTAASWNVLVVSGFLLIVGFFFMDTVDLDAVPLEGWMSLLYVSLLAMGVAYNLLAWSAVQTSTTVVAVYSTVMPVLSPIASHFMLGESVQVVQVVGMVITLTGVFLVIRARFIEEKQRALQQLAGAGDDVTEKANDTEQLLMAEKGEGATEDGAGGTVGQIVFQMEPSEDNNWLHDSDEEGGEESRLAVP